MDGDLYLVGSGGAYVMRNGRVDDLPVPIPDDWLMLTASDPANWDYSPLPTDDAQPDHVVGG